MVEQVNPIGMAWISYFRLFYLHVGIQSFGFFQIHSTRFNFIFFFLLNEQQSISMKCLSYLLACVHIIHC